ncbi:MAG: hypothetical protein ACI3Y0_12140 [Prevotella sp.]
MKNANISMEYFENSKSYCICSGNRQVKYEVTELWVRWLLGVWASRPHLAYEVIFRNYAVVGAQGAGETPTPPALAAKYSTTF